MAQKVYYGFDEKKSKINASSIVANGYDGTFGSITVNGNLKAIGSNRTLTGFSKVYNAVWNDLADAIQVPKDTIIEPGYCYCFDGEKYYKSQEYLAKNIIGIHSDTFGIILGQKNKKELNIAVAGFVLAYVDKEYEVGTPLTCTKDGKLTEISVEDKVKYPERIIGTFWKKEEKEYWGQADQKILVNKRCWIKIK